MKINTDFTTTVDLYKFASIFANRHNVNSRLQNAAYYPNTRTVHLYFEREAHSLDLDEVADELGVASVVVGKASDNKTYVLCGIGNTRTGKRHYTVRVTETYVSDYIVEAEDEDEAKEIAERIAENDTRISSPENMTTRESEIVYDA